ncbi:hypothetical protein J7T55_014068 [Diaporthe amygdali]|uniref:uncharacterized protein n=1 Tax=Phomopsis amygdali TaxID=1214568 RepID=UPI0022FF0F47|nr:uncharacterized protein J7T55_014068 [Diaporthe amygdali]KAJ0100693.1 hypothetical protein J7T55_014068 [Diaporthe amygdali]
MIQDGSLKALSGIPDDVQIEIAQNLPPYGFLQAASEDMGIIPGRSNLLRLPIPLLPDCARELDNLLQNDENMFCDGQSVDLLNTLERMCPEKNHLLKA